MAAPASGTVCSARDVVRPRPDMALIGHDPRLFQTCAGSIAACVFLTTCAGSCLVVAETWNEALARMPLGTGRIELNRTNCVALMLRGFQSNQTVKALIFMPGATDEFYMFRSARGVLTNNHPSLFDAVTALTNQTLIRVSFLPPLLLLHSDEASV